MFKTGSFGALDKGLSKRPEFQVHFNLELNNRFSQFNMQVKSNKLNFKIELDTGYARVMEKIVGSELSVPGTREAPQAATRWLDEEERATWVAFASVLLRLPGALDTQLQRDAGISHFEYIVMSSLSEALNRTLRMSNLAVMAESALPRLSQVVGRLEKRGWVSRTSDPTDGRSTLATLTEQGWNKVVKTAPGHVEEVRRLTFDPLTKDHLKHLNEISRRIMATIDPEDRCLRLPFVE
ncbi:MarR family transcriptional regulator [Arthrobacter sp. S39]|uniref:MarR family winged helix-turn-helix transcriptional regulator n=1 Tax=Arthrobacter sp. S39 TaxID=2509720 RepID=UPI00325AC163